MKNLKKYLKQLKKGIFFEAFDLIRKNPKLYCFILLMDALLLSIGYLQGKAGDLIRPWLYTQNAFIILAILLVYILVLILVYSFTKYLALYFVKNMLKKARLGLTRVKGFYLLNVIFIIIVVIALWIMSMLVGGVKEDYLGWVSRILLTLWLFFATALISIAHSLFALGFSFKDVVKNSFKLAFTRVNKYYGVYVVSLVVLGIYFLAYYGLGSLLDAFFTLDGMRYNLIFIVFTFILLYLLLVYNRIYFFLIVKRIKQK